MIRAVCRAIVRASAPLAPRAVRARWLEEWRAEIGASRTSPARLLARTLGAPVDALSAQWTTRDSSGWRGPWHSDIKQTLRGLWRSPGHVLAVTACLGLGIAVNVAVFSMINTLLFRELPGVRERDRIVRVLMTYREDDGRASQGTLTPAEYGIVREGLPAVPEIAAEADWDMAVAAREIEAMSVRGCLVSGNYFDVFGSRPELGRLLQPADDVPGADPVVVLSHDFWSRYLGQKPGVIGQPLFIGGHHFTIIGVAPRAFMGMAWEHVSDVEDRRPQLFVAMNSPATLGGAAPGAAHFEVFGRLASGQTIDTASQPLPPLADAIAAANPTGRPEAELFLRPGLAAETGETTLIMLLIMAGPLLVLAISCANAANLQLAHATGRARELVLRFSLGASRRQIVRLLMIEALVLGVLAAAVGTLGSVAALRAAPILPYETGVDTRVLLFTLGVVGVIVLGAGVGPALLVTSQRTLKADRRRTRVRNGLVVAQVTASMLLLLAAALTTRTLQNVSMRVPEPAERIVGARFNFGLLEYTDAKSRAFLRELTARLEADYRVTAVGVSDSSPGWWRGQTRYWLPGDAPEVLRFGAGGSVTPSYFDAMELAVRRGRVFRAGEELSAVVVDELFVRTHQLPEPVVGTVIRVGDDDGTSIRPVTIVGVVEDAMFIEGWDRPAKSLYLPMGTAIGSRATVLARTSSPNQLMQSMRAIVAAADPNLPAIEVQTVAATYREELDVASVLAGFAGVFGTVAMSLALAGIYAVVAYLVSQRTREIGVRMAIGARPHDVIALFVRDAARLIAWGIAIALAIGIPATWLGRALLFGLSPLDPASFAGTSLILLLMGLLAAIIPARRAARVDPLLALRQD